MLSRSSSSIRKFFASRRLEKLATIVTSVVSTVVIGGVIPNLIVAQGALVIGGVVVLAIAALGVISLLPRSPLSVIIRSPLIIRTPQEEIQYARQGFIGFVPLYTPQGNAAKQLSQSERWDAVEALDFDRLQVEESNLKPTITAIASHGSKLTHCWLISTKGQSTVGSSPYAHLLAEYLRQRHGLTCEFHYGETYTISMDDDALVLSKTYDIVERVFQEALAYRIPTRQIVADISTGVRSMILGMVLACLDEERDIEFVGTRYDDKGKPTGSIFPIVFSFNPSAKSS